MHPKLDLWAQQGEHLLEDAEESQQQPRQLLGVSVNVKGFVLKMWWLCIIFIEIFEVWIK